VKDELKKYFTQLINVWHDFNHSLPKVPWDDRVIPFIYEGDMDQDEYICWKPVEKDIGHDFADIEKVLDGSLHDSIKRYFNSYWFAELAGFYKNYNIILEPVLPGIKLEDLVSQLISYKEAHEDKLQHIPLGLDGENGFLIVIDNSNGNVKIEDCETGKYEVIADSLDQLIRGMQLKG
jgi:hypothetical protein